MKTEKKYCVNCEYFKELTIPAGIKPGGCMVDEEAQYNCEAPQNINPVNGGGLVIWGGRLLFDPDSRQSTGVKHYYRVSTIWKDCATCRKNQGLQPSCGSDGDWFKEKGNDEF